MDSKPFYLSRSNWAGALAFIATAINARFAWISLSAEETAGIMAVIGFIMRSVTKGRVTLS